MPHKEQPNKHRHDTVFLEKAFESPKDGGKRQNGLDEGCAPSSSASGSGDDSKCMVDQGRRKTQDSVGVSDLDATVRKILKTVGDEGSSKQPSWPQFQASSQAPTSEKMIPLTQTKGSDTSKFLKKDSSSSSSDHTDRDGVNWGSKRNREEVRTVKDHHDSVIHDVVLDNNPEHLRDLLKKGLFSK